MDVFIFLVVLILIVDDLDSGFGGKVNYIVLRIVSFIFLEYSDVFYCINELNGIFRIDEYMGILRVVRMLVVFCIYKVIICVMDYGSFLLYSVILIEIEIGNVIDLGVFIIIVIVL